MLDNESAITAWEKLRIGKGLLVNRHRHGDLPASFGQDGHPNNPAQQSRSCSCVRWRAAQQSDHFSSSGNSSAMKTRLLYAATALAEVVVCHSHCIRYGQHRSVWLLVAAGLRLAPFTWRLAPSR